MYKYRLSRAALTRTLSRFSLSLSLSLSLYQRSGSTCAQPLHSAPTPRVKTLPPPAQMGVATVSDNHREPWPLTPHLANARSNLAREEAFGFFQAYVVGEALRFDANELCRSRLVLFPLFGPACGGWVVRCASGQHGSTA